MPLSSEIPLAVAVRQRGAWMVPVAVATAGNYLGACTTYWLARAIVTRVSPRDVRTQRAAAMIDKYGRPALLLSWVPLIGDAIVALAGATRVPFLPFSAWVLVGKAVRYAAVGWAAARV